MIGFFMVLLLSVIILLALSAFFSGSETAVMSLDRYQIISLAEEGNPQAKRLLYYLENPEVFFSIVLLGNTFANISAASLFTLWFVNNLPKAPLWAGTCFLSIFVLLLCEMLPKSLATRYPMQVSPYIIPFIRLTEMTLYPVLIAMQKCMVYLTGKKLGTNQKDLDSQQIRQVLQAACSHLPKQEQHMLKGVLDLSYLQVEEVMLPKHMIQTININRPYKDVLKDIQNRTQNYYIITKGNNWNAIEGILYVADLVKYLTDVSLESLKSCIKPATYIQEGTQLRKQLNTFQKNQQEVAIVVNEYGDTIGVLEVHDIVEEVVGHYAKRLAVPLGSVRQDKHGSYWVRADIKVRDLNRHLNWDLPGETTTLGGFFLQQVGGIPDGCCAIQFNDKIFEAIKIKDNKIIMLHIYSRTSPHST